MDLQMHSRDINEQHKEKKFQANNDSNSNPVVTNNDKQKTKYFVAGPEKEANTEASVKLTVCFQTEFKDVFSDIGCSDGTFLLQVKDRS